jgi:hypothetical protein
MGAKSRRKGVAFELVARDYILGAFAHLGEGLIVRRSSQAERAYEADLIIEGPAARPWMSALWVECQHADRANSDPPSKWKQAVRDAGLWEQRNGKQGSRIPIVVWRVTGERTVWCTVQLEILTVRLFQWARPEFGHGTEVLVTLPFEHVLSSLKTAM